MKMNENMLEQVAKTLKAGADTAMDTVENAAEAAAEAGLEAMDEVAEAAQNMMKKMD